MILNDPVTLIDTGLPTNYSFEQLKGGLASVGLSIMDIKQVIVTHMHNDHTGGIMFLQNELNIPLYVHEQASTEIVGGKSEFDRQMHYRQKFTERCGVSYLKTKMKYHEIKNENVNYLRDGDKIYAGGRYYNVLYVPGHSQSDICLWNSHLGYAFVGDFLLKDISANAFISAPYPGEEKRPKPLLQLRSSFLKVRDLPFKNVYPGHGDPFSEHYQVIDKRFDEQNKRCRKIYQLLEERPSTVYEISSKMFPKLAGSAIFLGLSEVQGHLDLMLEKSQVSEERIEDVLYYKTQNHVRMT